MHNVSRWTRAACDAALAVILAPVCAACRCALETPTRGVVCASCWQSIPSLIAPVCDCCADPLTSWRVAEGGPPRCERCRGATPVIIRTQALGAYDGTLRAIIHALKYDGRRSLAPQLSARMLAKGSQVLSGADLVVPVPLHPVRQFTRGFNQAADLAAGLGLPVSRALRRTRNTGAQADLPAGLRHVNVSGAFRVASPNEIAGACIVLVDDVSTTGATLEACARALHDANAREIRALIAARAVSKSR